MPPTKLPAPIIDTDHLLARHAGISDERESPARKRPVGALVGVAIVVLLMTVGGLYFWGAHLNRPTVENNPTPLTHN